MRLCTASNEAQITNTKTVNTLLDQWGFISNSHGDELTVSVEDTIQFSGYCEFSPYRKTDVSDPDERHDAVDEHGFLTALEPYLKSDLSIQTVGFEYPIYPLINTVYLVNAETSTVTVTGIGELESTYLNTDSSKSKRE